MANRDDHYISIVGSMEDIDRFAKEHNLVSGAIDLVSGKVLDGWDREPQMSIGGGPYRVEKCRVGVCDIDLDFQTADISMESFVPVYRTWTAKYPGLRFMWRYCLDMGWGGGYIDETGDHYHYEDDSGRYVAEHKLPHSNISPEAEAEFFATMRELKARSQELSHQPEKGKE